jgi:hypothetical protein
MEHSRLQMDVDCKLPTYRRRLLVRVVGSLNPVQLRRLDHEERRVVMFLASMAMSVT